MVSLEMIYINTEQSSSINCITKKAICIEQAIDICRTACKNRRVLIYLGWRGKLWVCYANRSIIHLIKLEIPRGDEVGILVFGNGAIEVSRLVYKKLAP